MNPSEKSPTMEATLTDTFGFDRRESITANKCIPPPIGCGGDASTFRDPLSEKEYTISGLCQACQDKIFGEDEEVKTALPVLHPKPPSEYAPGPNDWVSDAYAMFSGQGEAVSHRYHKYVGKSGNTWLVADHEAAAENIYVTNNPANSGGEGFGGAHLPLPCTDGTTFVLKGGWHSGANGLFADTGIDVRNQYRTFVVLGMDRKHIGSGYGRTVICDVVYKDEQPTLGRYDRYKKLVARFPQAKFYYMSSKEGSFSGMTDLEQARWNAERDAKLKGSPQTSEPL